jgi:hypothetical protein
VVWTTGIKYTTLEQDNNDASTDANIY